MKRLRPMLLLIPIAIASPAVAENTAPNFANLDQNSDGYLSSDEARADSRVVERFTEADRDRDGYISMEEFVATWILRQK